MKTLTYPTKIVKSHLVDTPSNLLLKQRLQIDLREAKVTRFHNGSYVILDFGKEMRGGIRILTFSSDTSPIRVRFGESVGECCSNLGQGEIYAGNKSVEGIDPIDLARNATNDHAMRDFYITLPSWSDTPIGDTGFRFVRLDFQGEYSLKSVLCANEILSRRAKYVYYGEREVEKIFKTAKRTIDLCASSGYVWDGIKRDRLVWIGDLSPEVLALTTLYGRCKEVENSLDLAREHTPLPEWMGFSPTYSLWWIIMLKDYMDRTSCYNFIEKQIYYLQNLVKHCLNFVSEEGELTFESYFVDWPNAGKTDEKEGFRAIATMAAKSAIFLLEKYGKNTDCACELLDRLSKREMRPTTKVMVALKQLSVGTISPAEKEILLSGDSKGMSTFMAYYILKAVAQFDKQLAWSMMKEYFGGMLSLGATTFWEEFDVGWTNYSQIDKLPSKNKKCAHGDTGDHCYIGYRKSLCHGWSAGVIAFIYEQDVGK